MITGQTLKETHHGNPGERRILPAGILVELQPASNLPSSSPIKYWASPLPDHPWPKDTLSGRTTLASGCMWMMLR